MIDPRLYEGAKRHIVRESERASWVTVDAALPADWQHHHLNGGPWYGVPMGGRDQSSAAAIDLDDHGSELPEEQIADTAADLIEAAADRGVILHPWRSGGGRGIHLWAVWDEPQDTWSVETLFLDIIAGAGLRKGAGGLKDKEVELFCESANCIALPGARKSAPLDSLTLAQLPLARAEWAPSAPVPQVERPEPASARVELLTEDELAALVEQLPPEEDYHEWVALLGAMHSASGGAAWGLRIAEEWSARADNYRSGDAARKWRSFRRQAGLLSTVAAIRHKVEQATGEVVGVSAEEFPEGAPVAEDWVQQIEGAQTAAEVKAVATRIRGARLEPVERATIVQALGQAYLRISNVKVPVADLRGLIAPKAVKVEREAVPKWADGWVYVTHLDRFFQLGTGDILSAQGWDHKFRRYMERDSDGQKSSAVEFIKQVGLPTVTNVLYHPRMAELFQLDGRDYANSFVPSSVPSEADTLTAGDKAAQQLVLDHLAHLASRRREVVQWMMDWIAYNVQNLGDKVRWALLIHGVEGDGKTILLRIIGACIGSANVRSVGPQVVTSQFNGYAEGHAVVLLEELRVAGHNRHEVLNNLKPLITNDVVDVHKKGVSSYNAPNVTNYIACTNHADALPLTATDRRFGMVSTPWQSLPEMAEVVGCPADVYFARLSEALDNHGPAIRRMFLDYKISAAFNRHGPAPRTREKDNAIAMEHESEFTDTLAAVIAAGVKGVTPEAVCTDMLRAAASDFIPGVENLPKGRALAKAMLAEGYTRHPERVKWEGHPRTVWVKGRKERSTQEVRDLLNKQPPPPF